MNWLQLYDPQRKPALWTELARPDQYILFIADAVNKAPRDAEGLPFRAADGTEAPQFAALCDNAAEAEAFARDVVARHAELCCEVYDSEGKTKPPHLVIYHPDARDQHEGKVHGMRTALGGAAVVAVGIGFVVYDASRDLLWLWGYIIGLKCLLVGGSFLIRGLVEWRECRHERRQA